MKTGMGSISIRDWPLRNIKVSFGDILPKISKSSAFWDMGVNSSLKWLPLFSPDEAGYI